MTASRRSCCSSHINLVKYLGSREFGGSFHRSHQVTSDLVTSRRTLKPLLAETSPNCRSTYLLRLDPTNKIIAAAHGDRSITLYCAQTGRVLAKCLGHERSPWTLMFHPTQPFVLASGCLGGSVRLWHLDTLASIMKMDTHQPDTIHCSRIWRHSGAIASVAFHPTHPILVVACTQEVVFHDWVSGQKLSVWRFVSNYSRVRWVKFNPDGSLLYTATANPSVTYSSASGKLPIAISESAHSGPVPQDGYDQPKSGHLDYLRFPRTVTNPSIIPLDSLLEFLIRQSDGWFHQLGVCDICSVRLCRWAGTLGPPRFTSTPDFWQGTNMAAQVARSVANEFCLAGLPLSHLVQELTSPSPNTLQHILSDANPSAVAIIEDMPVHEFLLSRGNYCHSPPTILLDGGLCCGGHACDLVLMHRDLMRHSLCRSCLAAFWKWASPRVTWWQWSNSSAAHPVARSSASADILRSVEENKVCPSIAQHIATTGCPNTLRAEHHSPAEPPVGVCVRCQAGVGALQDPTAKGYVEAPTRTPLDTDPSIYQGTLPLAALELLRSRLSNANEVTAVTYMAPDLINDGPLTTFFEQSLRSSVVPCATDVPQCVVSLLRHSTLMDVGTLNSPQRKRRRMDTPLSLAEPDTHALNLSSSSRKIGFGPYSEFPVNDLDISSNIGFDESTLHVDGVSPDTHTVPSLSDEATVFGRLLSSCSDHSWNLPRPAHVFTRPTYPTFPLPKLQLFPFVDAGSRLLRPVCRSATRVCNSVDSDTLKSPELAILHRRRESAGRYDTDQSYDTEGDQSLSVTACCHCGHIVPRTFPVDPQSRLSAAVCENFVLSGVQYNPVNSPSVESERLRALRETPQPSASHSDTGLVHPLAEPLSPPSSPGRRGGIMYLVNRTNADFMLSAIHRSITEVISGLFVDMGEHGSANSLEDTTYRICRWELNFCKPSSTGRSTCPFSTNFSDPFIRPMPANIAVSYNANSLVLPHARLFNDSSICLSPDGRMLAAFVAPSGNQQYEFSHSSPINDTSLLDTFLAVYRLQPKTRRGQCLFYRRFATLTPVCLDFSPLCNYLVVGMATTRLPSTTLPPTSLSRLSTLETLPTSVPQQEPESASTGNLLPKRHTCVAQIFRLDRVVETPSAHARKTVVRRMLAETASIKHPLLLDPVSSSLLDSQSPCSKSSGALDRWHRLLLSSSSGVSLNTIVWNPNGGLFYGTTKGLLVIMRTQPNPLLSDRKTSSSVSSFPDLIDEKEHCTANRSSNSTLNEPLGVMC